MPSAAWIKRRGELTTYFDRTAAAAWARLTSTEPLGRIRETVRAGRDAMRATLLDWLPGDLSGRRLLDAGCGTGALALEAARRGAAVVGIDAAEAMIRIATERRPGSLAGSDLRFETGDMLEDRDGPFDHVVAMDSLIHYAAQDVVDAAEKLAARAERSLVFTLAPRTPALAAMHFVGRLLPQREHRAPAIEPQRIDAIVAELGSRLAPRGFRAGRQRRIANGFYISHALEFTRE